MKILVDPKLQQINWLDERFYTKDNETFVPSVTYILECYPKGFGFNQWLKDLGSNADQVVERAGAIGTRVHNAIHALLMDETVEWNPEIYSVDEWLYILRFVEFWHRYKPELLATEWSEANYELGYGGTLDLVCKIGAVTWLIDFKTSNAIYNSYELQIAAYRALWNETVPEHTIDRAGIFWFKAQTRGEDKSGKNIQGKGWQLKEFDRNWKESLSLFNAVHMIFKNENPNPVPKNRILPLSVNLTENAENQLSDL